VLGLAWSIVMTGLTVPWAWRSGRAWVPRARMVVAALGAAMVLYLVYVELFRIGAICLWCTAVHVLAVCLFGVVLAAGALVAGTRRRSHEAPTVRAAGLRRSPPLRRGRSGYTHERWQ
jgi:uncharacterized membrane protein